MPNISNDYNVSATGVDVYKPLLIVLAARAEARAAYSTNPEAVAFINACSQFYADLHNQMPRLREMNAPAVAHYDHLVNLANGPAHVDHVDTRHHDLAPSEIPVLMAQIDLARGHKGLTQSLNTVLKTGQSYLDSAAPLPVFTWPSLFYWR